MLDLEETNLEVLKSHALYNNSHITRFTGMLLERIPLLKATKCNNKVTVVFENTVETAINEFITAPNEDTAIIHKV